MRRSFAAVLVLFGVSLWLCAAAPLAMAQKKKGAATPAATIGKEVNACGCYKDSTGACFCGKKGGKCVCPGECEPKGCDEKRAKEIEREIANETRKAAEADKRQRLKSAAAAKKSPGKASKEKASDKAEDKAADEDQEKPKE